MNDNRDWVTLTLIACGFIASWVYAFIHPSNEVYAICVGGVGTFGAIFHWICVRDDKEKDA